jgi:hypothetical protein
VREVGRIVLGVAAVAVAALVGCGDRQIERGEPAQSASAKAPGWTYEDRRWGYSVTFPSNWHRAGRSLTPSITDPVEILSLATFPLREGDELCGARGGGPLARVEPAGALVTIQERGRGAYGGADFPPRPSHFRPDPALPGRSTWPYCAVRPGDPPLPMLDYWFGFGDAGRAFHVLVAVGRSAPAGVRRDAFRILDSLRFDANVKPDWQSSG